MSLHDLSWWLFGAGFGAVASMFLTGAFFVREFERRQQRKAGGTS